MMALPEEQIGYHTYNEYFGYSGHDELPEEDKLWWCTPEQRKHYEALYEAERRERSRQAKQFIENLFKRDD